MLAFIRQNKLFTVIFVIAAIIRFIPLGNYHLSYDELCGLRNSIYPTWKQMIDYGVKLDTHPVLVQIIINITVMLFGYKTVLIKLPFLIFSLAAIVYAYLFALKWIGKTPALVTALLFSFSYIFLFYSPLARMYAGGLFFCTALTYYLFEICFEDEKRLKNYFLFVLFILLCALNNHLSALFAFTVAFSGLFFQSKQTVIKYILFCLLAVVCYLPHLNTTFWQFAQGGIGHGQDGWLAAPDKWVLFSFLKTLLGTGFVWIAFATTVLYSVAANKIIEIDKKKWLLIILFLVNYSIIHLYSVYKAPVFQNSVMLFSAPCFIWFLSSFYKLENKPSVIIVSVLSLVLILQSLLVKDFFTNGVINQNGYESERYCEAEDKYGKGNVEAYFLSSQRYFVIYHELAANRRFNYFTGEDFGSLGNYKQKLKESKAKYILLGEPSLVQLEIAKEFFPVVLEKKQSLNVDYYLLGKNGKNIPNSNDALVKTYSISQPDSLLFSFQKEKSQLIAGNTEVLIDSLNEFCFSASCRLSALPLKEGNVILAKLKVESAEDLKDVGLHFSIKNKADSTLYFGGTLMSDFYQNGNGFYAYAHLFVGSEYKNWMENKSSLTFFVWNRSKNKFRIKDFQLQITDYWPSRWSWWD